MDLDGFCYRGEWGEPRDVLLILDAGKLKDSVVTVKRCLWYCEKNRCNHRNYSFCSKLMWLFFDCRALHGTWKFIAFDIVALEYVVHISRKSYLVLVCEAINYLLIILNIFFIVYSLVPLNIVLNFESFLDYCGCRNEIDGVQTKTKYTKNYLRRWAKKFWNPLIIKVQSAKTMGILIK